MSPKLRTGIVYCYVNKINNFIYIGKTLNENNRIRRHHRNALIYNTPFYCAIRKYGWDNFEYKILYKINGVDKNEIDTKIISKEIFLIEKYNTTLFGYNLTTGGDGSCNHFPSKETRLKMSKTRTGKKHPLINLDNKICKCVIQLDINGSFIKEYPSIAEAARSVDAKEQHISRCCYGIRNKTRGYIWKFKD